MFFRFPSQKGIYAKVIVIRIIFVNDHPHLFIQCNRRTLFLFNMITLELNKLKTDKYEWLEILNAMFEHAVEGFIISDSEGYIIRANPSAEGMFGYNKGKLTGKIVEELIPSKYSLKHVGYRNSFKEFPRHISLGKDIDLYARRKDGSEFPIEISLSGYKNKDESYIIALITDVTERKQYESYIHQLNSELEEKVNEKTRVLQKALNDLEYSKEQLSTALKKEQDMNDMKSRFITMASHEFRTPLSAISSSISLIEKYMLLNDSEKHDRHVQRVRTAVTNMTLILTDILCTEKLNEGLVSINRSKFSLKELTNEIIAKMDDLVKPGQEIIYTHIGSKIVCLDKPIIQNMLTKLISNAIKFSGEQKKIEIKINVSNNETVIKIIDQGIGIPEEEAKYIFQSFFRARNATNIPGTGLGLYTISKSLELLKGKIDFTSVLNEGTAFTITIPNIV